MARKKTMLTVAEVARTVNVSMASINLWRQGSMRRQPLPHVTRKHGGVNRVDIPKAELLKWLNRYRPDLAHKWLSK